MILSMFLYDLVNTMLPYEVYWLQYNTNCIGAVMKSNQTGTNTVCIVTNTLSKVTLTKS